MELLDLIPKQGVTFTKLKKDSGWKKKRLQSKLKELKKAKKIEKKQGKYYKNKSVSFLEVFKKNKFLILIILLGFAFRITFLGSVPGGIWGDELRNFQYSYNLLYNLHTSDGGFLPLFYDGDVESLFLYSCIPAILLFGVNQFSVRVTAVIIGTLSILVTYLFVKKFFNKRIALFSALLLAISPWHIQFSRQNYRSILVPFLVPLGFYLVKKGIDKDKKFIIISSIIFGFSLFSYTVNLVFLFLMMIAFFVMYYKKIFEYRKEFLIFCLVLLVFSLPHFNNMLIDNQGRIKLTSVFSTDCTYPTSDVFTNIRSNYLSALSLDNLFFVGDYNLTRSIMGMGLLFRFELPLILLGIVYVLKSRRKEGFFIILWCLFSVIPASLTCGQINSQRMIPGIPAFHVMSAFGLFLLSSKDFVFSFKGKKYDFNNLLRLFLIILSIYALYNIYDYTKKYFIEYNEYSQWWWNEDHMKAAVYIESVKEDYDVIYNFLTVFSFFVSEDKSFLYPNVNEKFVSCELSECDYSKKNLVYLRDAENYYYLAKNYDVEIVKEIILYDKVSTLLVEVNYEE